MKHLVKKHLGFLFIYLCLWALSPNIQSQSAIVYNDYLDPANISIKGLLGDEIRSSEEGRLSLLPHWNDGQLIKMFSEEYRAKNKTNDWYGEHAGKWLYTTSLAVERTGDPKLKKLLFETADELISYQDKNGYLGSYSPLQRISAKDYPMHHRSWDVWNLTYMTLGFLKLNEYFPNQKYLAVAENIGELFLQTFGEDKADITNYGTRHGLSATVILEAAVELFHTTKDKRYIDFGTYVLKRLNEREGLQMMPMLLDNKDLELVGDGKIYQNIWNLYAIARFYELQPDPQIMTALKKAWEGIYRFHLTLAGGPWGGVGKHLECFNSRVFFSPYGLVETCSVMSWIHFNKQMLRLTGDACYAQEIEKSVYNELLGAKYENGIDWNYHSFSNGCRHTANFNDCCPSSGALTLEEISTLAYSVRENGIASNLYTESEANINIPIAKNVKIVQQTDYPFDGNIQISLFPEKSAIFPLFIRIPDWVEEATVKVNGVPMKKLPAKNEFYKIERKWKNKDVVEILFPLSLSIVHKTELIKAPQSTQDIYSVDWYALRRGPLVYALSDLIFGSEREEIIKLKDIDPESVFEQAAAPQNHNGIEYQMNILGKKPLAFVPYYRTGDRKEGIWRITWLQNKIN